MGEEGVGEMGRGGASCSDSLRFHSVNGVAPLESQGLGRDGGTGGLGPWDMFATEPQVLGPFRVGPRGRPISGNSSFQKGGIYLDVTASSDGGYFPGGEPSTPD